MDLTYCEPLPEDNHETHGGHDEEEANGQGSDVLFDVGGRLLARSQAHEDGTDIVVNEVEQRC